MTRVLPCAPIVSVSKRQSFQSVTDQGNNFFRVFNYQGDERKGEEIESEHKNVNLFVWKTCSSEKIPNSPQLAMLFVRKG